MENKEQFQNRGLISRIIGHAMLVQQRGEATIFVSISGHVNTLQVSVHYPVWTNEAEDQNEVYGRTVSTSNKAGLYKILNNLIDRSWVK